MVGRGRTALSALTQHSGLRPSGSILLTGMCGPERVSDWWFQSGLYVSSTLRSW